ncbi:MAG: DUF2484 family protein [Alkalilacustris sp.]
MSVLVAAGVWLLVAVLAAPEPGTRWPAGPLLIASGVPILGWLTWVHGPLAGLLALGAGATVLRWPLLQMGRRLRRKVTRRP